MITLSTTDARRFLVNHLGLARPMRSVGDVLTRLRCIQLDPLDVIGTNADLVVMARVERAQRGDVWRRLFPRRAFEHFAKERCILPASAFPQYRERGHEAQAPWWRHHERAERLPPQLISAVLEEIREHGPVSARQLTDHGSVVPIDWGGWGGTGKATTMALEILWTLCDVVVSGRRGNGAKLYDIPSRALGEEIASAKPEEPFERWALRERVIAAGLLARASGPTWCILDGVRESGVIEEMISDGTLIEVQIEGSPRRYLATPAFLAQKRITFDDRVRVLGPLDPLMWDRNLVRHIFGFDYVWEVYKPAKQRKWGWYVCPLLHRDRLIGRVDAQTRKVWLEPGVDRKMAARVRISAHP